jgi:hypothetical protein
MSADAQHSEFQFPLTQSIAMLRSLWLAEQAASRGETDGDGDADGYLEGSGRGSLSSGTGKRGSINGGVPSAGGAGSSSIFSSIAAGAAGLTSSQRAPGSQGQELSPASRFRKLQQQHGAGAGSQHAVSQPVAAGGRRGHRDRELAVQPALPTILSFDGTTPEHSPRASGGGADSEPASP